MVMTAISIHYIKKAVIIYAHHIQALKIILQNELYLQIYSFH